MGALHILVIHGDINTVFFSFFSFPSYISGVHHFTWDFCAGDHILPSWRVHAVCVFVAGVHLSRTWMSGSSESVRWNACVHRLDLGLYSHPKEFLGNGEPMLTPKGKIPSTRKILLRGWNSKRCIKQAQPAQHTTNELLRSHQHNHLDTYQRRSWNRSDRGGCREAPAGVQPLGSAPPGSGVAAQQGTWST